MLVSILLTGMLVFAAPPQALLEDCQELDLRIDEERGALVRSQLEAQRQAMRPLQRAALSLKPVPRARPRRKSSDASSRSSRAAR